MGAVRALAQTNAPAASNAISRLIPPYGVLPPTFWQQHGTLVILAAIGAIVLAALGVWLWVRPTSGVIVPPEVVARRALEMLCPLPEDGALLSDVSRILRHYVITVFELASAEMTTSEFCHALSGNDRIGPPLADALGDFLRRCDERKFSARPPTEPIGAARRALELIELAESRRAQLRQEAAAQAAKETSKHA